jgi:hypothetical protein
MEGFLLGLASGGTCLAYCAPVLVPLMLGGGQPAHASGFVLAKFHFGRLGGYLMFGFPAWWTGQKKVDDPLLRSLMLGSACVALDALLLFFGMAKNSVPGALGIAGARK